MSVVTFEGDLAVGVRFAKNVQVSKVPRTYKYLYLLRFASVQFHLIIISFVILPTYFNLLIYFIWQKYRIINLS